ncbi:amidophosphoribosyltransferase [bacterium]|nr:amidophosphoribosyltransferase [bacterium]
MFPVDDKFKEECAIVGVIGTPEAANYCYLGLYAMQHRGHEGSGIVASNGTDLIAVKDTGVVADIFDEETLKTLPGQIAIGHNRYATFGSKDRANLQPFVANLGTGPISIAHNGNLVNADELRKSLEADGAIFATTSDTEVFLHLIAHSDAKWSLLKRIEHACKQVKGAYSLVLCSQDKLYGLRDPYGVRPLSLARLGKGYVLASETCAFDLLGAKFERDIKPGEIVECALDGGLHASETLVQKEQAFCVFEYIYFARPDSVIDGRHVYDVRKKLGAELARESHTDADIVIPVPDSGVPASIGYSQATKLPMEFGLIRNHYVGRTFIEPQQSIRDFGVKVKLNPNADLLRGKRVIVVDDSIVRGTTSKKIVTMLRAAGAKEVHMRISSPQTVSPCHYGIDTPSKNELIAATHKLEDICKFIGADTVQYLSIEGMYRAVKGEQSKFCDACFTTNYRLGII